MGFFGFNFIETSFFISLGITFVLILLMVYHFKERMSCMEQKGDTMFEIINNIVREMTNIKNAFVIQQQLQQQSLQPQQPNITYTTSSVLSPRMVPIREHVVEYESGDDSESDSDSESESSETDSLESDSGSDAELMNDQVHNETIQIHFNNPVINDTHVASSSQMDDDVKIINIHLDNYHTKPDYLEATPHETEAENQTADDTETDASMNEASINEEIEYKEVEELPKEEDQPQSIHVNKINNDEVEPEPEPKEDDKKESYKDLTIAQLKALVITKGITTSVSKLKKNELISLLENN